MSFAAGIGAGIACGIGCGIAAGERRARVRIEEHLEALREAGEIRLVDREGCPVPVDTLIDAAVAARGIGHQRTILVILLLGGLMALGLIAFLLLQG